MNGQYRTFTYMAPADLEFFIILIISRGYYVQRKFSSSKENGSAVFGYRQFVHRPAISFETFKTSNQPHYFRNPQPLLILI
jgi:hypothetical protein